MSQDLRELAGDPTFRIDDLLRKLEGQPMTVKTAGEKVDDARRKKNDALSHLTSAKQALSMAEAMAAMSMPADAKNDATRKAHIAISTSVEQQAVVLADRDVMVADSVITGASRDYQLQQDILTSLQKRADVITAALRFLAPR